MVPDCGLSDHHRSSVKSKKDCITYLLAVNATGTKKRQPLIIGKSKKWPTFKNKTSAQLGFMYRNNPKAWMNTLIYSDWLHEWDKELHL